MSINSAIISHDWFLLFIFDDVTTELGIYLAGFETIEGYPFDADFVCLDPEDLECEEPDLDAILAELTELGSIEAYMLYDPFDPTWYELGLDFTDLANGIVEDEYEEISGEEGYIPDNMNDDLTGITVMSIIIRVEDEAEVTLPLETVTTDVNLILQDVAKFAMTMEAYDYLRDIDYMYMMEDPEVLEGIYNTNVYLDDIQNVNFSLAFDLELSYITVVFPMVSNEIPEEPDVPDPLGEVNYKIVLNWLDGTLVFGSPVSMDEVEELMVDGDLVSEAAYHEMIDKVAESNWHTSKLFMVYLLGNMD